MELIQYLDEDLIISALEAKDKESAIKEIVAKLAAKQEDLDEEALFTALMEREKLSTTGIGGGVAVPHCKSDRVEDLTIIFARSQAGVDFAALDGKPCHLFFLLIAPVDSSSIHLKALAKIARIAKDEGTRQGLLEREGPQSLLQYLEEQEKKIS